jgi:ankyrin repeat protein
MLAAINNRAAALRALVAHGANVNMRTSAGWTALTYAAWRGHPEIVKLLLARGADPRVIDRDHWTVLEYASWRAAQPPDAEDLPGFEPVRAGDSGHAEVIALLKHSGDPHARPAARRRAASR